MNYPIPNISDTMINGFAILSHSWFVIVRTIPHKMYILLTVITIPRVVSPRLTLGFGVAPLPQAHLPQGCPQLIDNKYIVILMQQAFIRV